MLATSYELSDSLIDRRCRTGAQSERVACSRGSAATMSPSQVVRYTQQAPTQPTVLPTGTNGLGVFCLHRQSIEQRAPLAVRPDRGHGCPDRARCPGPIPPHRGTEHRCPVGVCLPCSGPNRERAGMQRHACRDHLVVAMSRECAGSHHRQHAGSRQPFGTKGRRTDQHAMREILRRETRASTCYH